MYMSRVYGLDSFASLATVCGVLMLLRYLFGTDVLPEIKVTSWNCYCDGDETSQKQNAEESIKTSLYKGPKQSGAVVEDKILLKQDLKEKPLQDASVQMPRPSETNKPSAKEVVPERAEKSLNDKDGQAQFISLTAKESKNKFAQDHSQNEDASHKKKNSKTTQDSETASEDKLPSPEEKFVTESVSEDAETKRKLPSSPTKDVVIDSVPADSHIPSLVQNKVDMEAKLKPLSDDVETDIKSFGQSDKETMTEVHHHAPDHLDQGGSTSEELLTQAQPPESEVMPSFDEWKKMMLAEQEKDGFKVPSPIPPGKKIASHKRRRNYASYECGAKIVASNMEAESTSRILNELVDEYMLNPCKAKIWFVIELCESIQAAQIELANFELFSSSPKEFALYWSDRFPTREWSSLGSFTAQDQRILQTFEVQQQGFGKFLKMELLSYYGTEHYCPLSLVRVFGTSMVDEYEEMETADSSHPVPDDEEDRLDAMASEDLAASKNLFGSATEAVMSIMKKAAQVLTRDNKEDGERKLDGKDEDPCKDYPDQELKNCTNINGTSLLDDTNVTLPGDDFVEKTLRSPVYSIAQTLLPYFQRCGICSVMPKVDDKQSHSEPVIVCRFLQAALGPVMFGSICHMCKEKKMATPSEAKSHINIPSILPSLTKSLEGVIKVVDKQTVHSSKLDIETTLDASLPSTHHSIPLPSFASDTISHLVLTPNIVVSESSFDTGRPTLQLRSSIQPTGIPAEEQEVPLEKITVHKSESLLVSSNTVKVDTVPIVISPSKSEHTETRSVEDIGKSKSLIEESISFQTEPLPPILTTIAVVSENITPEILHPDTKITSTVEDTAAKTQDLDDATFPMPVVDISIPLSEEYGEETKQSDEKTQEFDTKNGQSEIQKDKSDQPLPSIKIDPVLVGSVSTPPGQKESVFMRMGNRIKALELNMSLSSQYLQELSQRYRKQMEEMQKAFNRTIGTLNDTARKAAERDLRQQETIGQLQNQLANLTQAVDLLNSERNTLKTQMIEIHVFIVVVEAIAMITIFSLCVRRITSRLPLQGNVQETVIPSSRTHIKRRNSVDGSIQPISKKVKKRSNSEELKSCASDLEIVEPAIPIEVEPPPKVKKKHNKHKKNKGMHRSVSNPSLPLSTKKGSHSSLNKRDSNSSAGVLFSHAGQLKSKPVGVPVRYSHSCENCVKSQCTASASINPKSGSKEKERRTTAVPLQNLTNGVFHNGSLDEIDNEDTCCKNVKFSLKKFLKIQKRDSV